MNEYNEVIIKLLFSAAVGAVFGFDREKRLMPAGFRTYALVSLGSCLAMMLNLYIFKEYGNTDIARIAAAVVTGIGFLCAGSIIVTKMNQVRGLTTSAALWASGCIGLCIGAGYYFAAGFASLLVFLFLAIFRMIDKKQHQRSREMEVYFEISRTKDLPAFFSFADSSGIMTRDLDIGRSTIGDTSVGCIVTLILPQGITHEEALRLLREVQGVEYVRDIS